MSSKKTSPTRLQSIDKNFAAKKNTHRYCWLDAFDPHLALRGLGWPTEGRRARSFRRFPDRAGASLSKNLQVLSYCPASVFLSFFTNSPRLSVRLSLKNPEVMHHMPATGSSGVELYCREGNQWLPVATGIPSSPAQAHSEQPLLEDINRKWREYRLYLPLYSNLEKAAVGISPNAKITPAPATPGTQPIFFYGTSVTQGGCSSTAGGDFISILGRVLDTEVINFGFSGSGLGEPEVARLIREIDAEMFVLDYVANVTPEQLRKTLPEFVRLLREKRPRTPIVLLSNVAFNTIFLNLKARETLTVKRDIVMDFYLQAKRQGETNIHFIDGGGILPPNLTGAYVDGVHPTSHGFAIMAERLVPHLNILRTPRRGSPA